MPTTGETITGARPADFQDRLVNNLDSVSWIEIARDFESFDKPESAYDMAAIKAAYELGRGLSVDPSPVNAIMNGPWHPHANDHAIAFWMVSGNVDYLRKMTNRMTEDPLSMLSGQWALAALQRQYPDKVSIGALGAVSPNGGTDECSIL